MFKYLFFLVVACAPFIQGLPLASDDDEVILRLTDVRYQYAPSAQGPQLTDTWLTKKHLRDIARFTPDSQNVYYLFTRDHPSVGYPLMLNNAALLAQVDFRPSRRTILLVHGWTGSVTATSNLVLIPAFIEAGDFNVIVADWSAGAQQSYTTAVANTVTSGQSVARFVNWLNSVTGASLNDYHLVGHSLGGHQVGIIGRNLNGRAPYITSLDPAWPLWILNGNKFQADDGTYTEVMHTNAGLLGYLNPIGHVDFYPNGGINMEGCNDFNCDHDRCLYYMAESINTGGFTGTQCNTYGEAMSSQCNLPGRLWMGGLLPKTGARGIFYLKTNPGQPFSIY